MLQLISRRFLRELDKAPGGNNLQYILKCSCIPFFGNQGLHNEIMLGGNRRRSEVICEGSPYNLPITTTSISRSSIANSTGISDKVTKAAPTVGTLFCVCLVYHFLLKFPTKYQQVTNPNIWDLHIQDLL